MGQGLHTPEYFFQYWGALSDFLTQLELTISEDITPETSLALNQLTQLQVLLLEGRGESAAVQLQLPQLVKLTLGVWGCKRLPQLPTAEGPEAVEVESTSGDQWNTKWHGVSLAYCFGHRHCTI